MQRAFLDAQAGILAGSLQAGIPCPVCGSVERPRPAVLSEHAPTEEQVKCAKTAYDDAQAAASAASETAAAQKAKVEEKADALRRALETLLPGLSEEQAESAAQEQLQIAEAQIGELNAQIETAKQNIRRKENLDKQIPKTEDALRAAQDTRNKADKQIGMLCSCRADRRASSGAYLQGQGFRRAGNRRAGNTRRCAGAGADRRADEGKVFSEHTYRNPRRNPAAARAAENRRGRRSGQALCEAAYTKGSET